MLWSSPELFLTAFSISERAFIMAIFIACCRCCCCSCICCMCCCCCISKLWNCSCWLTSFSLISSSLALSCLRTAMLCSINCSKLRCVFLLAGLNHPHHSLSSSLLHLTSQLPSSSCLLPQPFDHPPFLSFLFPSPKLINCSLLVAFASHHIPPLPHCLSSPSLFPKSLHTSS